MQYRKMPTSDDELSVLGYGCMRLPTKGANRIDVEEAKKQVLHAIDNGVNYIDTAYPYHAGASESFLGDHILKDGYREKVYVATKLPCYIISKAEKFDEIFQKQMTKLKVDYLDYYLLHSLNGAMWENMKKLGIREWMDKIKASGKVRHMGFSFHGDFEDFAPIIDDYDFDFVQVQYNIMDENFQAGIRGIEYAASKNLGVIVMEPLRGGSLVNEIPKEVQKLYDDSGSDYTPAEWALRWVLNSKNVNIVLSGMNNMDHIDENIKVASSAQSESMTKEEVDTVVKVRNKYYELFKVGCTGCGYCMPCPAGINIPGAFNNLNAYYMFGKMGAKIKHIAYNGIMTKDGKSHYASDCTDCGQCEKKCPQHLAIRDDLKQVTKDLEGPFIRGFAAVARKIMNRKK